jgi:hypothetical protein
MGSNRHENRGFDLAVWGREGPAAGRASVVFFPESESHDHFSNGSYDYRRQILLERIRKSNLLIHRILLFLSVSDKLCYKRVQQVKSFLSSERLVSRIFKGYPLIYVAFFANGV